MWSCRAFLNLSTVCCASLERSALFLEMRSMVSVIELAHHSPNLETDPNALGSDDGHDEDIRSDNSDKDTLDGSIIGYDFSVDGCSSRFTSSYTSVSEHVEEEEKQGNSLASICEDAEDTMLPNW